MKLSEAIREGAKQHPQCFGEYLRINPGTGDLCTCALGAAFEAMTGFIPDNTLQVENILQGKLFIDTFPRVTLPDQEESLPLFEAVVTLNDDHQWTRERIADWLESVGF